MDERARDKLQWALEHYGDDLVDDTRRLEAVLRDLCGDLRQEVNLLVAAADEGVPDEIRGAAAGAALPPGMLRGRLVALMVAHRGLATSSAEWAVDSWAVALGRTLPAALAPPVANPFAPRQVPAPRAPSAAAGNLPRKLLGLGVVGVLAVGAAVAIVATRGGGGGDDAAGTVSATSGGASASPTTGETATPAASAAPATATRPSPTIPPPTATPTVAPQPEQVTSALTVTRGLPYSGKPGTGAIQVSAAWPGGAISGRFFEVYGQRPDVQGSLVTGDRFGSANTDNAGRASIEVPAGTYIVTADFAGYNWGNLKSSSGVTDVIVTAGKATLVSVAYGSVTFRASAVDGSISGQFVELYTQRAAVDGKIVRGDRVRSGSTDNTGSVVLGATPGKYILVSDFRGYNWGDLTEDKGRTNIEVFAAKDTPIDVRLGKIVAAAGNGAFVEVYTRAASAGGGIVVGDRVTSGTADNTGFWKTAVTAGTYVVRMNSRDYPSVLVVAGETVTVTP